MNIDAATDPSPAKGSLLTKVPGRARPQKQAFALFEEGVAELRRRYIPEVHCLFVPKAEDIYRWKVQLECGCTGEIFTRGREHFPDENSATDPFSGYRLPAGELRCWSDHAPKQQTYSEIVEWITSEVMEFPADPEEPEYGMSAKAWAKLRHAEPYSSEIWTVKLACGHIYTSVVTRVGWKPEDGPLLVSEERTAEMRRKLEASWSDPDGWPDEGPEREHFRKMLDMRWPRPEPEQECRACPYARRITGYQRIGWLVSRTPPAPVQKPAVDRKKVEAKLAAAQTQVERLRKQLGDLDE